MVVELDNISIMTRMFFKGAEWQRTLRVSNRQGRAGGGSSPIKPGEGREGKPWLATGFSLAPVALSPVVSGGPGTSAPPQRPEGATTEQPWNPNRAEVIKSASVGPSVQAGSEGRYKSNNMPRLLLLRPPPRACQPLSFKGGVPGRASFKHCRDTGHSVLNWAKIKGNSKVPTLPQIRVWKQPLPCGSLLTRLLWGGLEAMETNLLLSTGIRLKSTREMENGQSRFSKSLPFPGREAEGPP